MCLILLAYSPQSDPALILAANRDEFFSRPTRPLSVWPDADGVFAGRDGIAGGTWLGFTRTGRLAALTNFREPQTHMAGAPSRGHLVSHFLVGNDEASSYIEKIESTGYRYNGFNLLVGDVTGLWYYSNRAGAPLRLETGCYGLSNHLLDTPWPKVEKGLKGLKDWLCNGEEHAGTEPLFELLSDRSRPPDERLPDSGVGIDRERMLSPLFITGEKYGTRSSSLIRIDAGGRVTFIERSFLRPESGVHQACTRRYSFLTEKT